MSEMPEENMVDMVLDLTDAEILKIALMAHERDITLNKMIQLILEEYMRKLDSEEALAEMTREAQELGLYDDDDAPNVL